MLHAKTAHDTIVLCCQICGEIFDSAAYEEANESPIPCPRYDCGGTLKVYVPDTVTIANGLDRRGYHVTEFHIGKETDRQVEISICFKEWYKLPQVPTGFKVTEHYDRSAHTPSFISIGKLYDKYESKEALALQLAKDRASLYKWAQKCT